MAKLKLISAVLVILGFISLISGIIFSTKDLVEYGLCIGVAGIIGYAIISLVSSTSTAGQKSISN